MAWARVTHRYDDGAETEFCCGTDHPAYPDELHQLATEALGMYRDVLGEGTDVPDVLRDEGEQGG